MDIAEVQRVRGTLDLVPEQSARLDWLTARLRDYFERFGYRPISTPVLENLDLFLRKSGEEIAARMYAFTHWNRRLCLRPEFTASVMRAYVNLLQDQPLPVRLHYAGPTFRYEKPQRGRYRQFTQIGLECVGGPSPAADAEALAIACGALAHVGLRRYRLVVGHLGAVLELLSQLGMEEHAQSVVLGQMEPLIHRPDQRTAIKQRILDLLGAGPDAQPDGDGSAPTSLVEELGAGDATRMTIDLLERASLGLEGGSRSPEEIVRRLLRKGERRDVAQQVDTAVSCIVALHRAAERPDQAFPALEEVFEAHHLDPAPLIELRETLDVFRAYGVEPPEIIVDLSLGRGLRYYTGLVFEIYQDDRRSTQQICGGGRYDGLVQALGGRAAVPACGFSFGLERLDVALQSELPDAHVAKPADVLVAPLAAGDAAAAIEIAQALRGAGHSVELDVRLRGARGNLRHADRHGIGHVVLIGEREREAGSVMLRNMAQREEVLVRVDEVADRLSGELVR